MAQYNNLQNNESIYSDHLINQIHSDLDLLLQQAKISQNSVNIIREALPPLSHHTSSAPRESSSRANQPTSSSSPQLPSSVQNIYSQQHHQPPSFPVAPPPENHPPGSNFKQAKALWAYHGSAHDDLSFEKGDIIVILSEDNQDWWRGQILNSQQPGGLFPSNHVQVISLPPRSNSPARLPFPPNQPVGSYHHSPSPAHPGWQPAPGYNQPPQYSDFKAPQQVPPPPLQHIQSAPAPPVNVTVEKPKKNILQGRFGQALAGGAGFGAGSAVATHVVNAIL